MVWSSEMSARPSRYRSDLNFAIAEKFHEVGIEFPFPQRDVHIRDGVLKVENVTANNRRRDQRHRRFSVIPSGVEKSCGDNPTAIARDPSTSLRITRH